VTISTNALVTVLLLIVVLGIAALGAYLYIDYADQRVSTNNASIEGRIYNVSVLVPGKIERIDVKEGTFVEQGDSLAALDSTLQDLGIRKIEAAIRANELTIEKLDLPGAAADIELSRVRREELRLHLEKAKLLYDQTKIISPASGYVAHMQVEAGEYVVPGQTIMSIVNLEDLWITANFTEQQIRHIRIGQAVDIYIDAYPDEEFTGRVASIMPAGGAAFALFPADATAGNWVRVAQRIPVKIVFDDTRENDDLLLRIGMLARVRVER